jgi:hypothetical protein
VVRVPLISTDIDLPQVFFASAAGAKEIMGDVLKRTSLMALALLLTTHVAFAQHKHPADVAKIDAALPTAQITPAPRAQVVRYRNEGAKFHYAGNHAAAEGVLEKAKSILKIR